MKAERVSDHLKTKGMLEMNKVFFFFLPQLSISWFSECAVGEGESDRLVATSTRGGTEEEAPGP